MAIVNCLAIETNFDEKKIFAPIWSGRLKEEKVSHSSLTLGFVFIFQEQQVNNILVPFVMLVLSKATNSNVLDIQIVSYK